MKRFYKTASVVPDGAAGGFGVALDGRPVKTPAKQPLRLPGAALAAAVAEEWERQGDKVDPLSMPLTQLSNTALDRIPMTRGAARADILGYGDTDLVCYRATDPDELVRRQTARWDPLLDWAGSRLGARPAVTTGFVALKQPAAFHAALAAALDPLDDFRLAGLHLATGIAGSVLLGLALLEDEIGAEAAFEAAMVDDIHQLDRWGEDREARDRLARVRTELAAAHHFLRLLDEA